MADLKIGTTIGGSTVWGQGNLPLNPSGNSLLYKTFKLYSENDKPTWQELNVLPLTGGTLTGPVAINSNSDSQLTLNSTDSSHVYTAFKLNNVLRAYSGIDNNGHYCIATYNSSGTRVEDYGLLIDNASHDVTIDGHLKYNVTNFAVYSPKGNHIIRDHGNGNVTLSASKSDSVTAGDLYIGYNSGTTAVTRYVRLEAPMNWKGGTTLVNASGKIPWGALETPYYSQSESDTRFLRKDVSYVNNAYILTKSFDWTSSSPSAVTTGGYSGFYRHNGGNGYKGLTIHVSHPDRLDGAYARGFTFDYGSSYKVYTYAYDSAGNKLENKRVYTEMDKPSAAELGVIPNTDGTMSGTLKLKRAISTAPGNSTANPSDYGYYVYAEGLNPNTTLTTYGINLGKVQAVGQTTRDAWATNIFGPASNSNNRYIMFSAKSGTAGNYEDYTTKAKINLTDGEMYLVDGTKLAYHEDNLPAEAPFPDVWIPLNDSLKMIAGFGDYDKFTVNGLELEMNSRSMTFERPSTATYISKSGVMTSAGVDEPRFEKNGLLIEQASTNTHRYSDYTASQFSKTRCNVEGAATENGIKWYKMIATEGTTSTYVYLQGSNSQTFELNKTYTFSFFTKKGNNKRNRVLFHGDSFGSNQAAVIDYDAKTITLGAGATITNACMQEIFEGVFRVSITCKCTVAGGNRSPLIWPDSYAVNDYWFIANPQIEELPFATSYIPTNGANATRAADTCSIKWNENIPYMSNSMQASFFMEFDTFGIPLTGYHPLMYQNGGGGSNNILRIETSGKLRFYRDAGAQDGVIPALNTLHKVGIVIDKTKQCQMFYNGQVMPNRGASVYSVGLPNILHIGAFGSTSRLNGHIRNFRIWHRNLSNAQIRALS